MKFAYFTWFRYGNLTEVCHKQVFSDLSSEVSVDVFFIIAFLWVLLRHARACVVHKTAIFAVCFIISPRWSEILIYLSRSLVR